MSPKVSLLIIYMLSACLFYINAYFCAKFRQTQFKLNTNRGSIIAYFTIEFLLVKTRINEILNTISLSFYIPIYGRSRQKAFPKNVRYSSDENNVFSYLSKQRRDIYQYHVFSADSLHEKW